MPADSRWFFAIIAEDRAAFENATTVADLVLADLVLTKWAVPEEIETMRRWGGHRSNPEVNFLGIHQLDGHLLRHLGSQKRFHGKWNEYDIRVAKAVALFDDNAPALLLIALDIDRDEDRTAALARAVSAQEDSSYSVVVAGMNPEAEAWRIAAFVPDNPHDANQLASERKRLTFNPVSEPHRLTSTSGDKSRDVKICHKNLFDNRDSLEALRRPIIDLRKVAQTSGLPTFIDDIETALQLLDPTLR